MASGKKEWKQEMQTVVQALGFRVIRLGMKLNEASEKNMDTSA